MTFGIVKSRKVLTAYNASNAVFLEHEQTAFRSHHLRHDITLGVMLAEYLGLGEEVEGQTKSFYRHLPLDSPCQCMY